MIKRELGQILPNYFFQKKAIIIVGPRQSGKTTLLQSIAQQEKRRILFLNCDEPDIRKSLFEASSTQLKNMIGPAAELVLIDEAQRVQNIGLTLKLMVDQIKGIQVIATGSSSFELTDRMREPLTGRKFEFFLLPISTKEMIQHTSQIEEKRLLTNRLIYGMYPDVLNHPGQEKTILTNLCSSYLYKDIFALKDIRRPEIVEKLLEALALQVCSEVSYHELAQLIGVDSVTIMRYIDLLEKTYVIFRLRSFSRNLRNELKKSRKIYFFDNGIRNALISNFSPYELRTDKGSLWENFMVSERTKWLANKSVNLNRYFWRTKQQQEIDYLEERDGKISAYEFKWKPGRSIRFPKSFTDSYTVKETKVIDSDNYLDFLTD